MTARLIPTVGIRGQEEQERRATSSLLAVVGAVPEFADARETPSALLSPTDVRRVPRAFTLAAARPLGTKRGKGRGSFVTETRGQAIDFYRDIVQSISAWRAKPPRLPVSVVAEPDPPASPEPPPFAAPDSREIGQAAEPS